MGGHRLQRLIGRKDGFSIVSYAVFLMKVFLYFMLGRAKKYPNQKKVEILELVLDKRLIIV